MKVEFDFYGNVQQIPIQVLNALKAAEFSDEQIYLMSPKERFDRYCEWEGLINWSDTLWEVVLESQ